MLYNLLIPYNDFFNRLKFYYNEGVRAYNDEDVSGGDLSNICENWEKEVEQFLQDSLSPNADQFINLFQNESGSIFEAFMLSKYDKNDLIGSKQRLEYRLNKLIYVTDVLSVVDSIVSGKSPDINSISEKKDYILMKLYKVFNDKFYSIEEILKFNNIQYRDREPEELAEDLAKRGYLQRDSDFRSDKAKLTVKGASYVERKQKTKNSKASNSQDRDNIDKKLDDIITKLKALGYGQEILFDELEELRELQIILSKKTWSQVLKGKIIDMGIENVISKETAAMIYEFLTNDQLKLT